MSTLITRRANEIVALLILIILILLGLLIKINYFDSKTIDPRLLNPNLLTFINNIGKNDKVHAVMEMGPNGHDNLKVYGKNSFNEIPDCYWNKDEVLKPNGERIEIPQSCLKENITIDFESTQQYLVVTKAFITNKKGEKENAIFISDLDHKVKCVRWDGSPC